MFSEREGMEASSLSRNLWGDGDFSYRHCTGSEFGVYMNIRRLKFHSDLAALRGNRYMWRLYILYMERGRHSMWSGVNTKPLGIDS